MHAYLKRPYLNLGKPKSRHAPSFTEVSQAGGTIGILGDTDVQGNPSLSLEIQYIYHWQLATRLQVSNVHKKNYKYISIQ